MANGDSRIAAAFVSTPHGTDEGAAATAQQDASQTDHSHEADASQFRSLDVSIPTGHSANRRVNMSRLTVLDGNDVSI